jgi:hypothetical protein
MNTGNVVSKFIVHCMQQLFLVGMLAMEAVQVNLVCIAVLQYPPGDGCPHSAEASGQFFSCFTQQAYKSVQ